MKFISATILILLLFSQTFSVLFVEISFSLNKKYIANNLCENRYRPQLHCNGNCIFMKKITQEEKQDRNNSPVVKLDVSTVVISSKSFFAGTPAMVSIPVISLDYVHNCGKIADRSISVFHPPSV